MLRYTKSLVFAAEKHRNQRRKVGDIPYINHPLQVSYILNAAGIQDFNTLTAAVLHDTVEDTQTTVQQLKQEFGDEITNIVLECSDDKSLGKAQRKIKQIQKAKHASNQAKLVKIADKISNNKGLLTSQPPKWSKDRVQGYFIWSQAVQNELKGLNQILDKQMEEIFENSGINKYSNQQKQVLLKKYYQVMGASKD